MHTKRSCWTLLLALALALTGQAVPTRAADIDPYLPADTESVVMFNFRQVLDSPLLKKVGAEQLRTMLKSQEEVDAILTELGLDPLKDLDSLTVAGPASGEDDKGLIIVHGRFNLEKVKARAEKEAKDNPDFKVLSVKDGQGGEFTAYEFAFPNPQTGQNQTFFAAFANKTVLLAAPAKDYLIDGLKVKDGTKAKLKNKDFEDLLSKLNTQQSMAMATVGKALTQGPLAELPIKDTLEKITALAGGMTLGDGIKMEFTLGTKEADDARMLSEKITEGINTGLALLALAAMNEPKMAPLVEIIKSIRTSTKGNSVTIKAEVSSDLLEKLAPKDQ